MRQRESEADGGVEVSPGEGESAEEAKDVVRFGELLREWWTRSGAQPECGGDGEESPTKADKEEDEAEREGW